MICTNRMNFTFEHDALARDFVIFQATRDSGNYAKSLVPDVALQQARALSVAYGWGTTCYILYRRAEAEKHRLKETLEACEADVRVKQITSEAMAEKDAHLLAQLLCNAIPNLAAGNRSFHNLTGGLYYQDGVWVRRRKEQTVSFWTLQISFTWDKCIKLAVKTFSNTRFVGGAAGKPQYLFDPAAYVLRRALKGEKEEQGDRFVIAALNPERKNTVPFLEFGSWDSFQRSKVGVLKRFADDVKKYLVPYFTMTFVCLNETYRSGERMPGKQHPELRALLHRHPVYIQDLVEDETSFRLRVILQEELKKYGDVAPAAGAPGEGAILLRIIHEKDYYAETHQQDPYSTAPKNCIVQHLTVENFILGKGIAKETVDREKEDAGMRKVLQELEIKEDVYTNSINCFDWSKLEYKNPVCFVKASFPKQNTAKPPQYARLCVMPDGALQFDRWEKSLASQDGDTGKIERAFENRKGNTDYSVQGLLYEDIDNIQILRDTEQYTLPNMEDLAEVLHGSRDGERLDIEPIAQTVTHLLPEYAGKRRAFCLQLLEKLKLHGTQASRKELRHDLSLKTSMGKELNARIYAGTGDLIGNGIKQSQNWERYFGGVLDIRHYASGKMQYYYSGYCGPSLKYALPHACRIRSVASTGDFVQFEKYLPLLEVDFVRANGWTVLPFPFKYLKEWVSLQ